MKGKTKFLIFAISLVIIGGVGSLFTFRLLEGGRIVSETRTFEGAGIETVSMIADNVQIEVVRSADDEIKVTLEGEKPVHLESQLTVEANEGKLLIIQEEIEHGIISFDSGGVYSPLQLTVYLPEQQYEQVKVTNNFGDIKVAEINALELSAVTDSGGITLQTESLDRHITLETNIGDIYVKTANRPTNVSIQAGANLGEIVIFDGGSLGMHWRVENFGEEENLVRLDTLNGAITVTDK